jgi:uncharacterized protein YegL
MSVFKEFTLAAARPLPVIVLADVSGSMAQDDKITILNRSIEDMAADFAVQQSRRAEIQLAVITFGNGEARLVQPLAPTTAFAWQRPEPYGNTPLGAALDLVREMLEDRDQIPSRAYRPTLVLVSDGIPNDVWEEPLARLLHSERAAKAFRVAVAVGDEADRQMLGRFLANPQARVFDAHEAADISKIFRRVTMSVSAAVGAGDYQTLSVLDIDLDATDDLDALDD